MELYDTDPKLEKQQPFEETEKTQKIKGGFLIFLVYICLEAAISLWRWLFWETDSHYNFVTNCIFEVLPYIYMVAITVDAIARRKPNAIFWSKATLIFFIVISCSYLLVSNFNNLEFTIVRRVFTLCVSFAWILYFSFSKQVNQIFPKEKRKISKRDKVLISLLIIPYILVFFIGVVDGVKRARNNQLKSTVVNSNEYFDDIIVFSIPDGYYCGEQKESQDATFFVIKDESMVLVSSGTISDLNDGNLNSIAEGLFEEMRKEQRQKGTETNTLSIFEQRDNLYIFHKKFMYSDFREHDGSMELNAYVLFSKGTNKYAIVRECNPVNSAPSEIEAIVSSLRFK